MRTYFSILLTLCFFCTLSSAQTKIYLDQSAAGTASGTNWTNANTDIHIKRNYSDSEEAKQKVKHVLENSVYCNSGYLEKKQKVFSKIKSRSKAK